MSAEAPRTPPEVLAFYAPGAEAERLDDPGIGRLELLRTREILARVLLPAPAVVADVGGGAGVHARWLAERGYAVHLRDASAELVERARVASGRAAHPLASAAVADARAVDLADASADAVLLLGPLYHLVERAGRVAALAEARRVARAGAPVVAAALARGSSVLGGVLGEMLGDPALDALLDRDLATGVHENPSGRPEWFTTAYLHEPAELAGELAAAGLAHEATLAVEGPFWLLGDLAERLADEARRERLLAGLRRIEAAPALVGASAHLLALGRRAAS